MALTKDLVGSGLHTSQAAAIGGSLATGIVAFATGGQASATPLSAGINIIATCATGGDSVLLPVSSSVGDEVFIRNNGAASCNVFPRTGGAINGGSANAALALANGKTGIYKAISGTDWIAVVTA
jgi:hypothetical protein